MLLSRFWYLALAALGATALAALFMARSALDQQFSRHLEEQLQRDRYELELVLRSDARTRIDAIRGLAAHPDVRSVLRSSSGNRAIDDDARQALTRTLGSLNSQLRGFAGDLVFAVDSDGRIVAALGSEAPAGSGLGAFPLVERALGGYLRDDVWVWNDRVFRMAARPVVDQGRYIGAVVHGIEVDPDFAEQLSRSLTGATIAFFVRDRIIGSHMPSTEGAARAEDLSPHLGAALTDEALIGGGRTDPVDVADGTAQAVYSLVTGSASAAGVGYAISRPRIQIAGLGDLLNRMDFDRDLGTTNLLLLVGLALAAFLVGMGFMFLERDRPIAKLQEAARGLAEGRRDRFDLAQFRGKYRMLADGMNQALQRTFEAAGAVSQKKPPADLDDILGPTPESAEGPSFFGFAGNNVAGADAAIPDVPPRPNGAAAPASDPDATPSSLFESGPRPSIADTPKAPEPAKPAAPPPPPPPLGGPPGKPAWAKGTMLGVGAPLVPPPRPVEPKTPTDDEVIASPAPESVVSNGSGVSENSYTPPPPIGAEGDDDEEGQTLITSVPQELIDAAAEEAPSPAAIEEAHFREVFERFVETKRECGEATTSVDFDRFKQTLQKNRDAILSKHDAKSVRFTVYVKAGKAALKATPVR